MIVVDLTRTSVKGNDDHIISYHIYIYIYIARMRDKRQQHSRKAISSQQSNKR